MKKLFITLISSLALSSYAMAADQCDQIPGKWSGQWNVYGYLCKATGNGHKIGDNIYFDFALHSCDDQAFTMSGTCTEGKITLANSNATMSGTIEDNQILITGDGQQAYLSKS